jgi:chromosome segregation ATPase
MSGEQPSDFWSKLGEAFGDAFEKGRNELVKGAKIGRLAMDVRALENDRERLLGELGEAALAALREGRVSDEGLARFEERIRALDERITRLQGQRDDVAQELDAESAQAGVAQSAPKDQDADRSAPAAPAAEASTESQDASSEDAPAAEQPDSDPDDGDSAKPDAPEESAS